VYCFVVPAFKRLDGLFSIRTTILNTQLAGFVNSQSGGVTGHEQGTILWTPCNGVGYFFCFLSRLAMVSNGCRISDQQAVAAIEGAVSSGLQPSVPEPPHDNIELAAYYLFRKRGSTSDPFHNWLTAEKGLRFGFASRIA